MAARYSFNQGTKDVVFASARDLNASYKDLGAVCDAIRYKSLGSAMTILEDVIGRGRPILYRRHNTHMGSRHELGGRKGRYPEKCAELVRKTLVNAQANAANKGMLPEDLYVVHAAANKTQIVNRTPSKGILYISHGYGYAALRRSDIELARIEIGLAPAGAEGLIGFAAKRLGAARAAPRKPDQKKAGQKRQPKQPQKAQAALPEPAKGKSIEPQPGQQPAVTKKQE